jgi:transcription-repair coupling factor (superfamily II helicase)
MYNLLTKHLSKYKTIFTKNTNYSFSSMTKSFSYLFSIVASDILNEDVVIVCDSDVEAEKIYKIAQQYSGNNEILFFPSRGLQPYLKVSPQKKIEVQRVNTLNSLLFNKNRKKVVVTSILGIIEQTIAKKYLDNRFLQLKVNQNISMEEIITFLVQNKYSKVALVMEAGQFAVRGDIIDICSSSSGAFRVDLFGNSIEKIRIFDVLSQKTIDIKEDVVIQPTSEIFISKETVDNFKYNYQIYFETANKEIFELLDEEIVPIGLENYFCFLYSETATLLDYVHNPKIIAWDSLENSLNDVYDNYQREYDYRNNYNGIFKENYPILPPNKLLLEKQVLLNQFNSLNKIELSVLNQPRDDTSYYMKAEPVQLLYNAYNAKDRYSLNNLVSFVEDNKNRYIIILAHSEGFFANVRGIFNTHNIDFQLDGSNITSGIPLIMFDENIDEGFIFEDIIVITEQEITGLKKTFKNKKVKSNKNLLDHLSFFQINDIVVHNKQGFGRYAGLITLNMQGIDHDFMEIHYLNDEKLYIPVENIDVVTRYSGDQGKITLDKLGSSSFEKRHNKIKEKIKDIAYDLIKLAADRKLKNAPVIDSNHVEYQKFCNDFNFVETDDQLNAINDIIKDFTSGEASDRLVCGDVGFGKTEVAMRAIFLMANSGYQVALIAPTTLLCKQHFNNFKKRFANFPINIAQLSRFVSTKDKKQVKEDLASGKVDVVIGTHALFASGISFKNIGLIVIDEEQNFGVVHKEKLKTIKSEAHVLTLSATPIPRTIQMALKGVKELSLITTPPVEKIATQTYVLPWDMGVIRNSINKELERGGQVFFVCPRVSDIIEMEETLKSIGNISYTVVHGQKTTVEIENNMIDFENKKYQVLISTNIIESGLDLSNVNTIIIQRADMFGLAQLYQLRGRVGRSNIQSFAYLLYENKKTFNKQAEKRLQILQSLDYLGASFNLASYDLDMRGAGNLLGEEQSGHVKEIGFELYQKLLETEMNHLKLSDDDIEYDSFSPNIVLNMPVLIPKKYIADLETSMEMYQRIGRIKSIEEIDEIKTEMIDRFGELPYQIENLFTTIVLKIKCKYAGVEKMIMGPKGISLYFYNATFKAVDKLLDYVSNHGEQISMKPEGYIILHAKHDEVAEQIKLSIDVLDTLHSFLKN